MSQENVKIVRRLFDAFTNRGDLGASAMLLDESADLLRLVRSPVFTADEQTYAIAAVLNKAGIKGLAARFLGLVAQKRRLFAVAPHGERAP